MNTVTWKPQQLLGVLLYLIGVLFAVCLLITIFGQGRIKRFASDYITERIKPAVDRSADIAQLALESPLAVKYLSAEHLETLKREMADYRSEPNNYIKAVTSVRETKDQTQFTKISHAIALQPELTLLTAKILNWKRVIHDHFNQVYRNVLIDLRIFCVTNILGFIAAGFLISRASCWRAKYVVPSGLLTFALLYSTFSYVDQNWFFSLLLDSFMGIWYPICVVGTFGELLYDHYRGMQPIEGPIAQSQSETD